MKLKTRNWTSLRDRRPVADSRERAVRQRLAFIEFVTYWEGSIIRSKIAGQFGVSIEQATKDLARYNEFCPGNLSYDQAAKCYVASPGMRCKLITPSAEDYLGHVYEVRAQEGRNDAWLTGVTRSELLRLPKKPQNPEVLRGILRAINASKSIELEYWSFDANDDAVGWTRVTPHAIATDGCHWFVRAYDHQRRCFRTLLLAFCTGVRNEAEASEPGSADEQWTNRFDVVLVPNPRLSEPQRRFVEWNWLMNQEKLTVPVRYALLPAFRQLMIAEFSGSEPVGASDGAMDTLVVIANETEFHRAMAKACQQ